MAKAKNVVFRFDMSNPRANNQVETLAGKEISRITTDTRQAAREAILRGYQNGDSPLTIGLDLAGRIDPATGRRTGGILGMTSPQAQASSNFYDSLTLGTPAGLNKALTYELRDKRFDKVIQKAIDEGGSLDHDTATKMYGRYVDNAVKLRGETVARTETGQAVHAASHEAFAQGLEKTGYSEDAVIRTWKTAGDSLVRDSHAHMNGQKVKGLKTPFVTGNGTQMLHPLDASLGAKPEDIINCRCNEQIDIDFSAGIDNAAVNGGAADAAEAAQLEELAAIKEVELNNVMSFGDSALAKDVLAKQLSISDVVVETLHAGGGTLADFIKVVSERFPDRATQDIKNSIASAFSKLPKQRGIVITKSGGRYTLGEGGTTVLPPVRPPVLPPVERPPAIPPARPPVLPPTKTTTELYWERRLEEAKTAVPEVDPLMDSKNWKTPADATAGFRRRHGIGLYSTDAKNHPDFVRKARDVDATFTRLSNELPGFKENLNLTEVRLSHDKTRHLSYEGDSSGSNTLGLYYTRKYEIHISGKLGVEESALTFGSWHTNTGRGIDATLRHELGHALEEMVSSHASRMGLIPGGIGGRAYIRQLTTTKWDATLDRYVSTVKSSTELSKYGMTNGSEYWAEAFAAYTHPSYAHSSRRIDATLEKIFDRVLKKTGTVVKDAKRSALEKMIDKAKEGYDNAR